MKYKNRGKKGFTLLEILLVIAAIGILAAIVLVAINPNRQINQARQAVISSEKNTLGKAVEQFLIDTGSYPAGIDGVQRKVCNNIVNTDCVDLSILEPDYIAGIPDSTTYTVQRLGSRGRVYINTIDTALNFKCPAGYIRVPGNGAYNTKDFCVMKYEAKAVEINNPTVGLTTPTTGFNTIDNRTISTTVANGRTIASVASGYPLSYIGPTTAQTYCNNIGANLMNWSEYSTLLLNIQGQVINWPGGVVSSSWNGIYRGHTDNNPERALVASTEDNNGYFGTGNENETPASSQRRTHTLSNGEIIWDLSGNIGEFLEPRNSSLSWTVTWDSPLGIAGNITTSYFEEDDDDLIFWSYDIGFRCVIR